jgi:putative transposase
MKKSNFTETQILAIVAEAESGRKIHDICREHGITQAAFYIWKKKYGGLGTSELRKLRQLEDENARLKKLVADLSLDKHMLQEVLKKKL